MAAPIVPVQDDEPKGPGLREDVMLDDVDKQLKKQEADAKVAEAEAEAKRKAELEAKARQEAIAAAGEDPRVKALTEALRISEEARQRQAETARPTEAKVEPPKKMTREELNELYQKDPLAAIAAMQEDAFRTVAENVEKRLMPLIAGGAQNAKSAARVRHAEAFELFEKEMDDYVSRLPDQAVMNNPKAWDDLVAYFQGQPANLNKIIEHRQTKEKTKQAEEARGAQRESAGAHTKSEVRGKTRVGGVESLDDTEREIARALNPGLSPDEAYADYIKWRGVTS